MTDNTQELDKILGSSHCDFTPENINEYSYNQICKWCGAIRSNSRHKIKQALLDWHNKQIEACHNELTDNDKKVWIYADDLEKRKAKAVEEVLDRLESQFVEEMVVIFGETEFKRQVPLSAIQAERAKLKEVK